MNHIESVTVTGERGFIFQRILGRNDQPNLLQIGLISHKVGYYQMPDVNGIERTEEKTNFHNRFFDEITAQDETVFYSRLSQQVLK